MIISSPMFLKLNFISKQNPTKNTESETLLLRFLTLNYKNYCEINPNYALEGRNEALEYNQY